MGGERALGIGVDGNKGACGAESMARRPKGCRDHDSKKLGQAMWRWWNLRLAGMLPFNLGQRWVPRRISSIPRPGTVEAGAGTRLFAAIVSPEPGGVIRLRKEMYREAFAVVNAGIRIGRWGDGRPSIIPPRGKGYGVEIVVDGVEMINIDIAWMVLLRCNDLGFILAATNRVTTGSESCFPSPRASRANGLPGFCHAK